ncbi:hypothetical protein [Micromonospora maritima]|nr:hypothetical protein [Micromonospora maritima]
MDLLAVTLAARSPLPGPVLVGFFVLVAVALVAIVYLRGRGR